MKNLKEMEQKYFDYLNLLRESGDIPMLRGALSYLEMKFNLNKKESMEILLKWIRNFE